MVSTERRATAGDRLRPCAVGYVSTPTAVGVGTWARWHADVEAYAAEHRLPLLLTITHDEPSSRDRDGLAELVQFLRDGAHRRERHVGVVIVPTVEHLSPARDGSDGIVQQLLRLHFGVDIRAARVTVPHRPHPLEGDSSVEGEPSRGVGDFATLLFGLDHPAPFGRTR